MSNIESLIFGEVFDDFLEMAKHLLESGYIPVVPTLIGAVLEDGLRRISRARCIDVKENSDNIASLNNKLADAKVYGGLVRKKVAVWNEIRNNADHGKFEQLNEPDVRGMLEGVRDFLSTHLR